MIESFSDKGLRELFETGRSGRVPSELRKRIVGRLDALNAAQTLGDLDRPGFSCHPLKGSNRYAISVNGPWRITFQWKNGRVLLVDLEQYH
jgi:proteic killer suppression protein